MTISEFNSLLGHGRKFEFCVSFIALLLGVFYCLSPIAVASSDTFWQFKSIVVGTPWLIYGSCGLYGLLGNLLIWPFSRSFRVAAALMGIMLWGWVILLHVATAIYTGVVFGSIMRSMTAFAIPLFILSWSQLRASYLNLPEPGFPGMWK